MAVLFVRRASLLVALLASPALADLDRSFEGGTRADFEAFMRAGMEEFAEEADREAFGEGAWALMLSRFPAAAGLDDLQRLALTEAAQEDVGDTMAGLSYREIFEYGVVVSGRGVFGQIDVDVPVRGFADEPVELSEADLLACLREQVALTFGSLEPARGFVTFGDEMSYRVENRMDRAIASIEFRLTVWTEGREVPWGTSETWDPISSGVEPGEVLDRQTAVGSIRDTGEMPGPHVHELVLLDVRDAAGNFFMSGFGQEACAGRSD